MADSRNQAPIPSSNQTNWTPSTWTGTKGNVIATDPLRKPLICLLRLAAAAIPRPPLIKVDRTHIPYTADRN